MRWIATLAAALALGALACGPSSKPAEAPPSGTLVVEIIQGPERVPFRPQLLRIRTASEQLAARLGHAIRIEIDGALLPPTREGAEELVARLVEAAAQDVDRLGERDARALAFARASFERLVVRYSPAEAAERSRRLAKAEVASRTVDVVRAEASWTALERGEIAGALLTAFEASETSRFANVMPDRIAFADRRAWFEFHDHGRSKDAVLRVRGMVMLHGLAARSGDEELARDVKKWLVKASRDFSRMYADGKGELRDAEGAFMGWLAAELPRMSVEEKGTLAENLWPIDFRTPMGARDRFAKDAFPGIDRMKFATDAMDAWIAAGHPNEHGKVPTAWVAAVCPLYTETSHGRSYVQESGRCDDMFQRWAYGDDGRATALVNAILARRDVPLARAELHVAHRVLREPGAYLALLRRFEGEPTLWREGTEILRPNVFRPDPALLEESKRLWRAPSPLQRGWALFWFSRHAEGSYTPAETWTELLDGRTADDAVMTSYLEGGGWDAFQLLPVTWPALGRGGRVRPIAQAARALLDAKSGPRPGERTVSGTLESVAHLLCEERALPELAELRTFAQTELASRPGAGLSEVVAATDPAACKPKPKIAPKPTVKKPGPPPPDPRLFPPKAPLPAGER